MRINAGTLKGRNFYMPAGIKPTQSLLRAAIFDILGHDLEGITMLELYAGSGAISLEAISRGLSEGVLVEHDPKNAQVIRENFDLLGVPLGDKFQVIEGDALTTVKRLSEEGRRFDIVFFDPPFGLKLGKKTLKLVTSRDILTGLNYICIQADHKDFLEIPEGFEVVVDRNYGSSHLLILQRVTHDKS